jgi:hypothetical protein
MAAGVSLPVAVHGDVDDAQIDAEHVLHRAFGGLFVVDGGEEIENAVAADEIAFTLPVGQQPACPVIARKRDREATGDGPEGNPVFAVAKDTVIVGDAAVRAEERRCRSRSSL